MTFEEYQKDSRGTANYPKVGASFIYPALGLAGETGEVLEKIKKIMRDDGGVISSEKKVEIAKELGDVLWYLTQIATDLEISLSEVARLNLEKLKNRMERGVIKGSGDNR